MEEFLDAIASRYPMTHSPVRGQPIEPYKTDPAEELLDAIVEHAKERPSAELRERLTAAEARLQAFEDAVDEGFGRSPKYKAMAERVRVTREAAKKYKRCPLDTSDKPESWQALSELLRAALDSSAGGEDA